MYEKKGQMAGDAVGNIIALIIGVGVAVLVLIFVGSLGGQTYNLIEDNIDEIGNNVVLNEAFLVDNVTAQTLNHGFIQLDTLTIFNSTATIGQGNFSIDADAGSILATLSTANSPLNGTNLYANYTWGAAEVRTSVKNSIVSGFSALEQTGDYLPIIVLAVVIALVLALVLGFTAFSGGGRMGGTAL